MEVRAAVALDVVWIGLTVLAVLAFVASVASLVQGILLRGGVRRGMRLALGAFLPSVALILPVRGLDEGFDENLRALLSQAYPRYRLLVVADDSSDPAAARIETIARDFPRVPVARILSDANPLGGKVNALLSALGQLVPEGWPDGGVGPGGLGAGFWGGSSGAMGGGVGRWEDVGRGFPPGSPPIRDRRVLRVQRLNPVWSCVPCPGGDGGRGVSVSRRALL